MPEDAGKGGWDAISSWTMSAGACKQARWREKADVSQAAPAPTPTWLPAVMLSRMLARLLGPLSMLVLPQREVPIEAMLLWLVTSSMSGGRSALPPLSPPPPLPALPPPVLPLPALAPGAAAPPALSHSRCASGPAGRPRRV